MLRRILGIFEGIMSREGGRLGIPTFTVPLYMHYVDSVCRSNLKIIGIGIVFFFLLLLHRFVVE